MTDVKSAVPATQAMTEAPVDPPTMKHAGRLDVEGATIALVGGTLLWTLIAVGAMTQAVLTSHGRRARGFGLNAAAACGAMAIIVVVNGFRFLADLPLFGILLARWGALAILAFAVGSLVRAPNGKGRRGV